MAPLLNMTVSGPIRNCKPGLNQELLIMQVNWMKKFISIIIQKWLMLSYFICIISLWMFLLTQFLSWLNTIKSLKLYLLRISWICNFLIQECLTLLDKRWISVQKSNSLYGVIEVKISTNIQAQKKLILYLSSLNCIPCH